MIAREERGSAVVEFALVVPLLLVVALAIVQVAVVGRDRLLLQHASRAGARQAAVDPDDEDVRRTVLEALGPIEAAGVAVEIQRAGAFGEPVSVTVGYDAPVALPMAGWLLPASVHLSAGTTMRQEFG